MKYAHNITITEFLKTEDKLEEAKKALRELLPFDLEQEKILLKEDTATGVNEQPIKILTITLQKETHTTKFLEFLKTKLSSEQKKLLISQKESRTDDGLYFFIRLEKDKWNKASEAELTDSGNCIHIKISLAAFPAKRDAALKIVEKILTCELN